MASLTPCHRRRLSPALVVVMAVVAVLAACLNAAWASSSPPPSASATAAEGLLPSAAPAKLELTPGPTPASTTPAAALPSPTQPPPADLQQRLQRLQEQRKLCAQCDCFALRKDGRNSSSASMRVSLDANLDDVQVAGEAAISSGRDSAATTTPRRPAAAAAVTPTALPPANQVLVINCTARLSAEDLPRWSWPARLSAGEAVAAETWAEFRGGDLSGVRRLPLLPFRLSRLSLAGNQLRSVASRAFANLGSLRDLDLSHNLVADVPHDAFAGLASLESLNLSRNSLSSRPLSADLFKELVKLRTLALAHNKLTGELNGDTLPWSGSMEQMDLSYNELTSVSAGAWRWLPNIKILDLSHNALTSLTPDAFLELRSLERLDLSYNALASLPPGALSGLQGLRSLRLSHNALRTLPSATFAPAPALASLDLSHNALTAETGVFAVLAALPASLLALDLSHNPLGRVNGGLEGQREGGAALPAGLQELSLAGCGLQDFDVRAWGGLHALRRLQLSTNDISVLTDVAHLDSLAELNASRNGLTRFPTAALPALRVLDLSHNQLERAPSPLAPALAALLLDDNPMEELRLAAAPSLALLSARAMPLLRALPSGAVHLGAVDDTAGANATAAAAPAPCLVVRLSDNPVLADVHEGAFPPNLCELELSHNALHWLPPRLANWSALRLLDLQGNPWQCTCRLQWMLDTVVRQLYSSSPALLEDVRCAGPAPAAGRRLVHWFNHTGRALCDGELMDLQSAGTVTLKLSPATLIVIGCLGAVAIGLVLLGILAHQKYMAKRRARNRRL